MVGYMGRTSVGCVCACDVAIYCMVDRKVCLAYLNGALLSTGIQILLPFGLMTSLDIYKRYCFHSLFVVAYIRLNTCK